MDKLSPPLSPRWCRTGEYPRGSAPPSSPGFGQGHAWTSLWPPKRQLAWWPTEGQPKTKELKKKKRDKGGLVKTWDWIFWKIYWFLNYEVFYIPCVFMLALQISQPICRLTEIKWISESSLKTSGCHLRWLLNVVQSDVLSSYLCAAWQFQEDVIDLVLESSTKHLISLIQHKHFDVLGCWKSNKKELMFVKCPQAPVV